MDRWVEMDLDWFVRPGWGAQTAELAQRLQPLWQDAAGERGIIINPSFLVDFVMVWSGDPDQTLPLRAARLRRWADATYSELRDLLSSIRHEAAALGNADLKLGIFVAGPGQVVWPPDTASLYDLYGTWYERHPEIYPLDISLLPGPDLDPRIPLEADGYRYAAYPDGIEAGASFAEVLAAQWSSLAEYLNLDALHLRDGFLGNLYSRSGPYGTAASPDPEENRSWTDAAIDLCRSIKQASPSKTLMLYSSGIGGTAEWRVGCVDIEAVIAAGDVDVFVDQTWGGAWQDWWEQNWKSWSFQVADLAVHGAMIRGANTRREVPCRHYKLIETWDGWEPWDTIHLTPEKLEWGIWALAHTATLTPNGPLPTDGSYISWLSYRDGTLLSEADIEWLATRLDAAEASAATLEEIHGPTIVHDREAVARLHGGSPDSNHSEWVEDQVGFLMKWGIATISSTRTEWIDGHRKDGLILQVPSTDPGGPVLAIGRAGTIDPGLLGRAGAEPTDESASSGYDMVEFSSSDLRPREPVSLPDRDHVRATGEVLMSTTDGPLLTRGEGALWWQPPDFNDPSNAWLPHQQIGSPSPYVETARVFSELIATEGGLHVDPLPVHLPATLHMWRSGGKLWLLAGNLETGWIGDSRHPRSVTVRLPAHLGVVQLVDDVDGSTTDASGSDSRYTDFTFDIAPEGFRRFTAEIAL